jgi:hypothetical protein
METGITRGETPEEKERKKKLSELASLEEKLAQRELNLATLQGELQAFENQYIRIIGVRYAELNEIVGLGYNSFVIIISTCLKSRDPDISLSPPRQPLRVRGGQ